MQTYNLLELLDNLEPFDTIKEGDMVIRLAPDESPVMKNYVPMLARESLDALSKRWEFTPKGPILVEMFPKHDDFAVRTLGLPGMIGALGACFGRVVTLDSPTAREPGTFNWGETLWHELAHVITLQLSGNRLPRWLSEGTSVFEERRARPDWGREMDIPFARAIDRGGVIKIRELNSGLQQLADDQLRLLPGVAGRRAHSRHLRPAEAARAGRGVCRRQRHRDGDQEGARHRHRRAAEGLRCSRSRSATRRCGAR